MNHSSFETQVRDVFAERFASLFRYLNRVSGDPDLAADVAQEALVRLYQRGSMPEDVPVWLVTVANNLVRDTHRRSTRRRRLLEHRSADAVPGDGPAMPDAILAAAERGRLVRAALRTLPLRDQRILVLRHEGYSYREIAAALDIAEGSVGTLLVRATEACRAAFLRSADALE